MHSFIHPFILSSIHSFIHSSVHPSIHSFIHPSTYSFIHSFIYSSIHPLIHAFFHPSIHSLIHSFIHPSIHPFIHSLCADVCGALLSIDTTLHFLTNYSVFQCCCFIRISVLTTLISDHNTAWFWLHNPLSQTVPTHNRCYEITKTHAQDIKLDRPAESYELRGIFQMPWQVL